MLNGNKILKPHFKNFFLLVKDLLFPIICLGCHQEGEWLCLSCLNSIPINLKLRCPVCGQSSFYGRTCQKCIKKSYLTGLWAVSLYDDDLLKKVIRHYKYLGIKDLTESLSWLMIDYVNQLKNDVPRFFKEIDLVTPVPLHQRRILHRGFNQAHLLAQNISNYFGWPILCNCLVRVKFTTSQIRLKKKLRKSNVSGAFKVVDKKLIKDKRIVVIDDVVTTGSTLQECARVLKKAGAKEVWGLVLAQD